MSSEDEQHERAEWRVQADAERDRRRAEWRSRVDEELDRQRHLWGDEHDAEHDDFFWFAILSKQMGDVSNALLRVSEEQLFPRHVIRELSHVAAVLESWGAQLLAQLKAGGQ